MAARPIGSVGIVCRRQDWSSSSSRCWPPAGPSAPPMHPRTAAVGGGPLPVTAETVNEALNVGSGALRIASVRSRSVTTFTSGDPEPKTVTALTVEGGTVGGYSFAFGPGGFVVASQGIPVPADAGVAQINTALQP